MTVPELFSLSGQNAIVTGGAGAGIGRAISLMFAEAGAMVAVTDLKVADAEAVAAECAKFGVKALALKFDVTDEAERVAVVERVATEFGKLTLLVNNAGGGGPKPFDMPMRDFEWAFQLNVYSLFRLSQLAHPHMKAAGGGAIVNISSMAGENKNKRMCSCGGSKAAVNHLTRNMAFDLRPDNTGGVPCVGPGASGVDTGFADRGVAPDGRKPPPPELTLRVGRPRPRGPARSPTPAPRRGRRRPCAGRPR